MSCWWRLRRHRWRWTGGVMDLRWNGPCAEFECESCGLVLWRPR